MKNSYDKLEKSFSNNIQLGYIESIKYLFSNLGIDVSLEECSLPLTELLKLKSVSIYDYRIEIRKLIGTSPLLSCGANCILYCITPNNSIAILIQNRSDLREGKYCFCGGGQEIYVYKDKLSLEPTTLTAYREIEEETGYSLKHIDLIPYFDYSSTIEYQTGDIVLASSNFYIAKVPYLELLEMSQRTCKEQYNENVFNMTHSLIDISNISKEFIHDFAPNHRPALIKFLREFCPNNSMV